MERHNELPAQRKYDDYEYTTVDGFAQKYGFSRNEAIGRIKWFLCATGRESLWESEKIYIQRSEGRMMIFTPDDIAEYEALLEKEKTQTTPEPAATTATATTRKQANPDVTGRKGAIKAMVLGGLQAFYDQKERLPEDGNAFQEFLDFVHIQCNQKTKPVYMVLIGKVSKTGTDSSNCITVNGVKKPKNRKYISSEFYKFKKDFTPQVTTEAQVHP